MSRYSDSLHILRLDDTHICSSASLSYVYESYLKYGCLKDIIRYRSKVNIENMEYKERIFSMKMNKKATSALAFIVCVAMLGTVASAASKNAAVGSVGRGYANVLSSTSATAWTTANAKGTTSSDYVAVDFDAHTYGTKVWGPVRSDGSEGEIKNVGSNYVEAYGSNSNAANIKYVDSYHTIQRGGVKYDTTIYNTQAG